MSRFNKKVTKQEKPLKAPKQPKPPKQSKPKKSFSLFGKKKPKPEEEEEITFEEEQPLETEELSLNETPITKANEQGVFIYAPSTIYEQVVGKIKEYDNIITVGCSDATLIQKYFSEQQTQHIILLLNNQEQVQPIIEFLSSIDFVNLPVNSITVSIAFTSKIDILNDLKHIRGLARFTSLVKSPTEEIPISVIPNFMSKIIQFQPTHNINEFTKPLPKVSTGTPPVTPPTTPLKTTEETLSLIASKQNLAEEIDAVISKLVSATSKEEVEASLEQGSPTYKAMDDASKEIMTNIKNHSSVGNTKEANSLIPSLLTTNVKKSNVSNALVQDIVKNSLTEIRSLSSKINDVLNVDLEINESYESTSEVLLQKRAELRTQVETYLHQYKTVKDVSLRALHTHVRELESCNKELTELLQLDDVPKETSNVVISVIKTVRENIEHSLSTKEGIVKSFQEVLNLADKVIDVQQKLIQFDDDIFTVMIEQKNHLDAIMKSHINNEDKTTADTLLKEKATCVHFMFNADNEMYNIFKYGLKSNDIVVRFDTSHIVFTQSPISSDDFVHSDIKEFNSTLEIKVNPNTDKETLLLSLEKVASIANTIFLIFNVDEDGSIDDFYLNNTSKANIVLDMSSKVKQEVTLNKLRYNIYNIQEVKSRKLFCLNFNPQEHISSLEELKATSGISTNLWDIIKIPNLPQFNNANITVEQKVGVATNVLDYIRRG